jgi:hypothetical protein
LPSPEDYKLYYWRTPIFPGSCNVNIYMQMYVPDTLYLWTTVNVYLR